MARRPDLVGLTVLAMLSVRAGHPYELHRFIVDTHKDYVTGLPRSLYHAVEKLAGEQLIVPVETTREGRRPERTVYEITDEGRMELSTRLRGLIVNPVPTAVRSLRPSPSSAPFWCPTRCAPCASEPAAIEGLLARGIERSAARHEGQRPARTS